MLLSWLKLMILVIGFSLGSSNIFEDIFNNQTSYWAGSGFFINSDGYLITASHVYEEHKNGKVIFTAKELIVHYKGQSYPATLVAIDYQHDVAILHINANHTPYFELDLRPKKNTRAIELGYPLSFTNGTNLKQSIVKIVDTGYKMPGFLLTAGLACAGNSGGPVVTTSGTVVGELIMGTTELHNGDCGMLGIDSLSIWAVDLAEQNKIEYTLASGKHPETSLGMIYEMANETNSVVLISGHN